MGGRSSPTDSTHHLPGNTTPPPLKLNTLEGVYRGRYVGVIRLMFRGIRTGGRVGGGF